MVRLVQAGLVGKVPEVEVDSTEEEGGARREVVEGLVTWARVEVTQSIHKDTIVEMDMLK